MPLKRAGLFMYPWDFIDEGVDDLVHRVRDLGVTRVGSLYEVAAMVDRSGPG